MWSLICAIVIYIFVIGVTWACTMLTTMNWTQNGKFLLKEWFYEYRNFLIPLWCFSTFIIIMATILIF